MILQDEKRRSRVRSTIITTQHEAWFTPVIAPEDAFLLPNFDVSQIFYSERTTKAFVDAFDSYQTPCCLCAPRLAAEWFCRGRRVTLLDIDQRFADFSDFIYYDILYPTSIERKFDLIVVDPPAFDPEWICATVDVLSHGMTPDIFVVFRLDQRTEVLHVFRNYRLQVINFPLFYCNVRSDYQATFQLYGSRPEIFSQAWP
jgi:Probable N6-adenine methyltransferase